MIVRVGSDGYLFNLDLFSSARSAQKRPPPPPVKPKPVMNNNKENENKSGEKEAVEVYCRLRPLKSQPELVCVHKVSDQIIRIGDGRDRSENFYSFNHVFSENTGQRELFTKVALPLVDDLINGKDGKVINLYFCFDLSFVFQVYYLLMV